MLRTSESNIQRSGDFFWEFVIIITIFCSFGFPGNFENHFGGMFSLVFKYLPFFMQITVMLFSSGQSVEDIRIIDLKKRYISVYAMLLIFFAVSMMVTSFPKEQVIACLRFSVTALFALWITEHYETDRMLEFCYYAQILFVLATIAHVFLFPGSSFSNENGERSLIGLFSTKNPCGTQMSFGIVLQLVWYRILLWKNKPIPRHFVMMIVVQGVLMLMSKTTGAVFCALIPLFYVFFIYGKDEKGPRLPLGMIHLGVSVGFLLFSLTIIPLFEPLFEMIGKDATLTGRIPMWKQLIDVMTYHNTMTGFGFTMFWKDYDAVALFHAGFAKDSWGNTMTFGAHNSLLELWLDVGLIGVVTYFFMIMSAFSPGRISKMTKDRYIICSAVILWLTVKGLLERLYIPFNYQTLFLFYCIGLSINSPDRKKIEQTAVSSSALRNYAGRERFR